MSTRQPSAPLISLASLTITGAIAFGTAACCTCTKSPQGPPPNVKRQFFYSAGAFAVGGTLTDIQGHGAPSEPLLVQAATLLPPAGGKGVGRIENGFRYGAVDTPEAKWVIVIDSAETSVTGQQVDGCYVTTATSKIDGLNVLGRLKAKQIETTLVTRRCLEDGRGARFRTLSADFTGLTIDGVEIKPVRMASFGEELSASELIAKPTTDRGPLFDVAGAPDAIESALARRPAEQEVRALLGDRLLLASIVAPVSQDKTLLARLTDANPYPKEGRPEFVPGNGIHIPNFGKVYFGRALITGSKHETIMLHLDLGSPVKGPIDIGGDFGNGFPYP